MNAIRRRPFPVRLPSGALALLVALAGCSGGGDDDAPSGDAGGGGSLALEGRTLALTRAIALDFGPTGNHYNVDVGVADSDYVPITVNTGTFLLANWEALDNGVEFRAELYSPGDDAFRFGRFEFLAGENAPGDDVVGLVGDAPPALAGRALFGAAYVGVDVDGSGEVDDFEEVPVVGGTVEIAPVDGPFDTGFDLVFDVALADGTRAAGRYAGEALYVDER